MSWLFHLQHNERRRPATAAMDSRVRTNSCMMSQAVGKLRSIVLIACACTALPAASAARSANRDALRQIVTEQCAVHWLEKTGPAPCVSVYLPDWAHRRDGYGVLADIKGGAHFLLIPTTTIAGIESPEVLAPDAPNYFAAAWRARDELAVALGRRVARDAVGLAVNPQRARTQDQLHIHIECLAPEIHRKLQAAAERLNDRWSPITLAAGPYQALRLPGEDLGSTNPFVLLAERMPGARRNMGAYTLMIAGMQFKSGPGFVLLTGKNVPGTETLLDSSCALARRGRP
jgi:CDP-diacylglycerol pyrophosphatase